MESKSVVKSAIKFVPLLVVVLVLISFIPVPEFTALQNLGPWLKSSIQELKVWQLLLLIVVANLFS